MVRGLRGLRKRCSAALGVAKGALGGGVVWRRGAGAGPVMPKGCPAAESVGEGMLARTGMAGRQGRDDGGYGKTRKDRAQGCGALRCW